MEVSWQPKQIIVLTANYLLRLYANVVLRIKATPLASTVKNLYDGRRFYPDAMLTCSIPHRRQDPLSQETPLSQTSPDVLIPIHISHVRPGLQYLSPASDPYLKGDIRELGGLQPLATGPWS